MPERIPQSATLRVPLYAVLASDHVSAGTGLTLAITISKNGGAFSNPSAGATNAVAIASGWYYVDLSATDTGTLGPLIVLGSAGTADPVTIAYNVVDAANGGLSNLDVTVSSRATAASISALVIPSAAANADALLDRADAVETGLTPRQSLRLALSARAGKISGGGTTTNTFRNPVADSKNRIVATVDANGNRTAITYDMT
jgi:hypothetical protein